MFCQPPPSQNSCIFMFYKFRAMTDQWDRTGNILSDEQHLNTEEDRTTLQEFKGKLQQSNSPNFPL
jgi:hypothetical protein